MKNHYKMRKAVRYLGTTTKLAPVKIKHRGRIKLDDREVFCDHYELECGHDVKPVVTGQVYAARNGIGKLKRCYRCGYEEFNTPMTQARFDEVPSGSLINITWPDGTGPYEYSLTRVRGVPWACANGHYVAEIKSIGADAPSTVVTLSKRK